MPPRWGAQGELCISQDMGRVGLVLRSFLLLGHTRIQHGKLLAFTDQNASPSMLVRDTLYKLPFCLPLFLAQMLTGAVTNSLVPV